MWLLKQFDLHLDKKNPDYNTPSEYKPRMDLRRILSLFQDDFYKIYRRDDLDQKATTYAAAAIANPESQEAVDPHLSFGIATYGMIEGVKTVPPSLTINLNRTRIGQDQDG
jgi:hypothetical protein